MKWKNVIFICFPIILIVVISTLFFNKQFKIFLGTGIDILGFTKNTFQINIDPKLSSNDIYLYWMSPTEYGSENEMNKLLVYHRNFQIDIPDSYGKNIIVLKYKDLTSNRMGIFKKHACSKYHYKFDIKLDNNDIIINWSIKNWYDTDSLEGIIRMNTQKSIISNHL